MRSHDFGQFLFNASVLNEIQLADLLELRKKNTPTLATTALFLRLLSASELVEAMRNSDYTSDNFTYENLDEYLHSHDEQIQEKYDVVVREFLTPKRLERTKNFSKSHSLVLLQELIDNGVINGAKLERLLDKYHHLEIPPVEEAFAKYYNRVCENIQVDYPFALDILESVHGFLSDNFSSTIILIPGSTMSEVPKFGASIKIMGNTSAVVGLLAEKETFDRLSRRYDDFDAGTLEDDYDAISEMLNVFTGHYTVKVANLLDIEQELDPPRFGQTDGKIDMIKMISGVGDFCLYIGKDEIFPK